MSRKYGPPMNYDFIANWDKIIPHLHPGGEIDKILAEVMTRQGLLNGSGQTNLYTSPPSSNLCNNDDYDILITAVLKHVKERRDMNILTEHDTKILDAVDACAETRDDEELDRLMPQLQKINDKMMNTLGYNFEANRDNIAFWVPFGSCHSWNAIWGIWLAKKMIPDGQWVILKSAKHTTVYSMKHHMCFDILSYFWSHNRLLNHCLNKPLKWDDDTLGGADAFLHSMATQNTASIRRCKRIQNKNKKDTSKDEISQNLEKGKRKLTTSTKSKPSKRIKK